MFSRNFNNFHHLIIRRTRNERSSWNSRMQQPSRNLDCALGIIGLPDERTHTVSQRTPNTTWQFETPLANGLATTRWPVRPHGPFRLTICGGRWITVCAEKIGHDREVPGRNASLPDASIGRRSERIEMAIGWHRKASRKPSVRLQ